MIKQVRLKYSDGRMRNILLYEDEISWFLHNEGDHLVEYEILSTLYNGKDEE